MITECVTVEGAHRLRTLSEFVEAFHNRWRLQSGLRHATADRCADAWRHDRGHSGPPVTTPDVHGFGSRSIAPVDSWLLDWT